jgi:hypothetical protein
MMRMVAMSVRFGMSPFEYESVRAVARRILRPCGRRAAVGTALSLSRRTSASENLEEVQAGLRNVTSR